MSCDQRDYEYDLREVLTSSEEIEEKLQEWYNAYRSIIVDANVISDALETIRAFNYFKE